MIEAQLDCDCLQDDCRICLPKVASDYQPDKAVLCARCGEEDFKLYVAGGVLVFACSECGLADHHGDLGGSDG